MNDSLDRPAVPALADSLPSIAELRLLEEFLDWMENRKSAAPQRWKLVIFPLLPVIALAATLWCYMAGG
jgi:hypothetical protein